MRELIEDTILRLNMKTLGTIQFLMLSISFTDLVDFSIRSLSGVVALIAGLLAWENYRLKNKLLRKQIEFEEKKMNDLESKKA